MPGKRFLFENALKSINAQDRETSPVIEDSYLRLQECPSSSGPQKNTCFVHPKNAFRSRTYDDLATCLPLAFFLGVSVMLSPVGECEISFINFLQ
jgi:hypothetical protein